MRVSSGRLLAAGIIVLAVLVGALPYSLDLLTLSVEAGLDFTGALAKVVEKGKAGPLREELQIVLKQLKMGKWPLYAFSGDAAQGDVNGQGSGGSWFVVAPDGKLIK